MSLTKTQQRPARYKPVITSSYLFLLLLTSATSHADDNKIPTASTVKKSIEPIKCFEYSYTTDEYKTVKDKVISKEASTTFEITHASFQDTSTTVKVKDESSRIELFQTEFQDKPLTITTQEARTDLARIPIEFETTTERVMVQEAYTQFEIIP